MANHDFLYKIFYETIRPRIYGYNKGMYDII
jgi:hypothetical protein